MPNDQLVVSCRRLGADLRELKRLIRKTYPQETRQVTSAELKKQAAKLAESWLAELSKDPALSAPVIAKYVSDLNVNFQRILVYSEHATIRSRYDKEINAILKGYTPKLIVPLMQVFPKGSGRVAVSAEDEAIDAKGDHGLSAADAGFSPTAFVGHSFAQRDKPVVDTVIEALRAIGIDVVTGEKPKAEKVSTKVKGLIDGQHMFVGIFTRRDKLVGKEKWSTSAWVIDEKAYASRKKLILLVEEGVESIGGIQGDAEYIEFSPKTLAQALVKLLQFFNLEVGGLK